MTLMARLERTFGRFAIPDLTLYLVCGQAGLLLMGLGKPDILQHILFIPALVLQGEWWRVLTFVLFPPLSNPLFAAFALYMFWLMGTQLESHWGTFRYNVYLLIAYLASVGGAFLAYAISGAGVATSAYFDGSVFLAFATLYPDFVIYLFFILPIRIKWIALATWIFYGFSFVTSCFTGNWMTGALVVASVLNYLLFFAADIKYKLKHGHRTMRRQLTPRVTPSPDAPFHTCATCGITDKTHPKMDFRYCPGCGGQLAYCTDHLHNHQHRAVARQQQQ